MIRFSGQENKRVDRILLVGIGYDKQTKKHRCKVEEIKQI